MIRNNSEKTTNLQSNYPCTSCMLSSWSPSPTNTYLTAPATSNHSVPGPAKQTNIKIKIKWWLSSILLTVLRITDSKDHSLTPRLPQSLPHLLPVTISHYLVHPPWLPQWHNGFLSSSSLPPRLPQRLLGSCEYTIFVVLFISRRTPIFLLN